MKTVIRILMVLSLVTTLILTAPHMASAETAPDTTLVSFPIKLGASRLDASTFTFTSNPVGANFECSLDGATWTACTSPKNYTYAELASSTNTFYVRALASDGTPDTTPASTTWTVSPYEQWTREIFKYVTNSSAVPVDAGAVAIDASGNPHVVFGADNTLVYAHWIPGTMSWESQVVYQTPYDMGQDVSLVLDGQGHPHITFYHVYGDGSAGLYYAASDGSTFTTTLLDHNPSTGIYGRWNSLALDAIGHPHISYYNQLGNDGEGVHYASFDGTSWTFQQVEPTCSWCGAYGTSLALDASGNPRICYSSGSSGSRDLKYAAWNGTGWDIETVDSFGDVGAFPSLVLDGSGAPHISYGSTTDLLYAVRNQETGSWDRQVVAVGNSAYSNLSSMHLALDSSGRPHITNGHPAALRYFFWDGQAWQAEIAGHANDESNGGSFALDSSGRAFFAVSGEWSWETFVYEEARAGKLRAALALSDQAGGSYPTDVPLSVCLSGGTIGTTADCKTATGDGGTVEWSGLMPGSSYTISAGINTDWTGPADQSGLQVTAGAKTDVTVSFIYTGSAVPDTTITGQPMFEHLNNTAAGAFKFESNQTDSEFECSLDSATFSACTSPQAYSGLADGSHSFQVQAKNSRGAVDASPDMFTWTINTASPWQLAALPGKITEGSAPGRILFDADGRPLMAYRDHSGSRFAYWNGQAWEDRLLSSTVQVWHTLIATAPDGRVHLAFTYNLGSTANFGLQYAIWNGTSWAVETIPGLTEVKAIDFKLDASGKPRIAMLDGTTIKYVTRDDDDWRGKAWKVEAVTSTGWMDPHFVEVSMVLDSAGDPHIAFMDNTVVKYVVRGATSWGAVETVTDADGSMFHDNASLALDGAGNPSVAFCEESNGGTSHLHYAVRDASGVWQSELAGQWSDIERCMYPSLALDADGNPRIASFNYPGLPDYELGGPEYTVKVGGAWVTQAVDPIVGYLNNGNTFLTLDAEGRPNILYPDNQGTKFMYAVGAGAPVASAPAIMTHPIDQTAVVGDAVSFNAAATGNPTPIQQWQMSTDGGTNWSDITGGSASPLGFTASLAQNGYQYRVVFTNSQGSATSDAATLTVGKLAASLTLSELSYTYDGQPKAATVTTNPAGLTVAVTYDGSATQPTNASSYAVVATIEDTTYQGSAAGTLVIDKASATVTLSNLTHTYDGTPKAATATTEPAGLAATVTYDGSETAPTNASSYAVAATITDGNYQGSATDTLVINKSTATISLSNLEQAYDGSPKPATVTTDPAGLSVSVTYDGSTTAPTNAGSYVVVATITDANYQGSGSGTLIISSNSTPLANPGEPYLGAIDTAISFDGSGSSDPDNDSLTYAWDFGDGSTGTGAITVHSYAETGIYDVCLTVNDGMVDSEPVCTLAVAYDPNAGYVTGGGWIDSPAGAYTPDGTLSGKATFGFVSKYKKGAIVPDGNTEFQFQAADLNFQSGSYDWLVVNQGGTNAQYKGSGAINGAFDPNGNAYKFMLWAGDGTSSNGMDTFRMRIWWEDTDAVEHDVYDNGTDQEIGGGNIVVHTNK